MRTRRIFAFLVDAAVVLFLMVVAYVVIAVVGVFTLGLALAALSGGLAGRRDPLFGADARRPRLGDARHALHRHRDAHRRGGRMDYGLALLHALLFWVSVAILTPLVLLVALFTERKQLLHDLVLGTAAVRSF